MPKRISRRDMLGVLAASTGASLLAASSCRSPNVEKRGIENDLTLLDLSEAALLVQTGEVSPIKLTQACLDRIGRIDPLINSFITVTAEGALDAARQAEKEIRNGGWRGPLHGIPIAVKDNVDTAGVRTTAASAVFADRVPTRDAEVIQRLKAAGAIILGKLNMHEFALGTTSAISHFGPVHNPWDLGYVAGGSSGGSGAAVAAGLCFGAVGTDTGGSVRIPASCCGIVGLKPTFDVVSREGTIPVSSSFDHVGPMCRNVADTGLMLAAMTSHPVAKQYEPRSPVSFSGLRVGVVRTTGEICDAPVEPEVQGVFDAAIDVIRGFGAKVKECSIAAPDLGGVIDYESYAYHAPYISVSPELYDARTRETILSGREMSKKDYLRLAGELGRHRRSIDSAFAEVDMMVLPTLPGLPIEIRSATEPFSLNACTFAFSVAGVPTISVPCGFSKSGLPIGLLIAGPPLSEARLLDFAAAYEKAAGLSPRRPTF